MDLFLSNNELLDTSSDTDHEKEEANDSQKSHLKADYVKKFEELKQKRAKINERRLKRLNPKPKNQPIPSSQPVNPKLSGYKAQNSNQPCLTNPALNESVSKIEKSLNLALKKANIDKAEKLSDELFAKQAELEATKTLEAINFEIENKNKSRKKKPLAWRFEAKQKWESKSNM